MKKFEKKNNIKIRVIFLILLSVIIFPNKVVAKANSSSSPCSDALFGKEVKNKRPSTITMQRNASNVSIRINLLEGTWDVYYYIGEEDDDWSDVVKVAGGLKDSVKNNHFVYHAGDAVPNQLSAINRAKKSQQIFIFMALKEKENNYGMSASGEVLEVPDGKETRKCIAGDESEFSRNSKTNDIQFKKRKVNDKERTPALVVRRFTIPAKLEQVSVNKSDSKECQLMKECTHNSEGGTSQYDLDSNSSQCRDYNAIMKQSFSYCYQNVPASFDINDATIRAVRKSSLRSYKEYLSFTEAKKDNGKFDEARKEITEGGYKPISLTNNKAIINNTLACDKKSVSETTEKYYTEKVVEDNSICKVTCQEQFQVTYDPPVTVKAGLCFQYKVTVRSKVTCKTEDKGGINWPRPPETCGYTPICEDDDEKTQAGPSDDFDACISSCDDGKYSQKCINKCYQEVYENNKNKNKNTLKTNTVSSEKVSNVQKLAKTKNDPFYQDNQCNTNKKIKQHLNHCADFFSKTKQKYPLGYYVKSTKNDADWIEFKWHICNETGTGKCKYYTDDDELLNITVDDWNSGIKQNGEPQGNAVEHIKRASPYYLRSSQDTLDLLKSFFGIDTGRNAHGIRYYEVDNRGIKRQWSAGWQCHEVCGYVSDGGDSGTCKTSSKEVKEYYTEELEAIETNLAKCTANATCKEDVSTFHIDVQDKKVYSDKGKDKEEWNATNTSTKSKGSTPAIGGDTSMFIPLECTEEQKKATPLICDIENTDQSPGINGECYGRDNPNYWQHYKTTITFPGTWINLKSAERIYNKPASSESNQYREKKNYYCTGYDSEDVNVDWWNWKENGKGNIDSIKLEKDDNITAKISDFGKFNWAVNLKCFFGLYTGVTPPETPPPDCVGEGCNGNEKCPGPNCPMDTCSNENSTALCNYKFRVIDQENMFPDEEGSKGKRERGFNWTSSAKDNTIPASSSYNIDPEKYWQELEANASTAFPANDSEFSKSDYRVKISVDDIKKIREYVKKNNFNSYTGSYHQVENPVAIEGLYYYKTRIKELGLVSEFTGDLAGKNNN